MILIFGLSRSRIATAACGSISRAERGIADRLDRGRLPPPRRPRIAAAFRRALSGAIAYGSHWRSRLKPPEKTTLCGGPRTVDIYPPAQRRAAPERFAEWGRRALDSGASRSGTADAREPSLEA